MVECAVSDCVSAGLAGADADDFLDVGDENLAVADAARLRCLADSVNGSTQSFREQAWIDPLNSKFKVDLNGTSNNAENPNPAWRSIPNHISLEDIFCIKEKRKVARDHTFSFEGDSYLITTDLKYSIYNHDIELRFDGKSNMRAIFAGRDLTYKKIQKCPKRIAN